MGLSGQSLSEFGVEAYDLLTATTGIVRAASSKCCLLSKNEVAVVEVEVESEQEVSVEKQDSQEVRLEALGSQETRVEALGSPCEN